MRQYAVMTVVLVMAGAATAFAEAPRRRQHGSLLEMLRSRMASRRAARAEDSDREGPRMRHGPMMGRGRPDGNRPHPMMGRSRFGGERRRPMMGRGRFGGERRRPMMGRGRFGGERRRPMMGRGRFGGERRRPMMGRGRFGGERRRRMMGRDRLGGERRRPMMGRGRFGGDRDDPATSRRRPGADRMRGPLRPGDKQRERVAPSRRPTVSRGRSAQDGPRAKVGADRNEQVQRKIIEALESLEKRLKVIEERLKDQPRERGIPGPMGGRGFGMRRR